MMSSNAGFYGARNVLSHNQNYTRTWPTSSGRVSDNYGGTGDGREDRQTLLEESQHNQDLILTLTNEIKKSVNDSMEGVVTGLRNEVKELRSELQSMKDQHPSARCASKRGRFPKILLVSLTTVLWLLVWLIFTLSYYYIHWIQWSDNL